MSIRRSKRYLFAGALVMAIVVFALYQMRYSTEEETIHIAFGGPMSGDEAEAGRLMTRAIQLYLDDVNDSGGINGKNVVLDVFDDRNKEDRAGRNALKMVEENRVLAVIGHWYSSCSISAGAVYKEHVSA